MTFEIYQKGQLDLECLRPFLAGSVDGTQHLKRLACQMASVDRRFVPVEDIKAKEQVFYELMLKNQFIPAPSILCANLNKPHSFLNEVALKPSDDFDDIFETLKMVSVYLQHGVHVAVDFSGLRASRSLLGAGGRQSLGPIKFMPLFEQAPRQTEQEATLRFYLNIDHLDIVPFIDYMRESSQHLHFAVGLTDQFMQAVQKNEDYGLTHKTGQDPSYTLPARQVLQRLFSLVEEGISLDFIFIDRVNQFKVNHSYAGELILNRKNQLVLPHELMASGLVNLLSFVDGDEINEIALSQSLFEAIHFLDNCLEENIYPHAKSQQITKQRRSLSLSVLGIAEVLFNLAPSLGDKKETRCLTYLINLLNRLTLKASKELAATRGGYQKIIVDQTAHLVRHAQILSQVSFPQAGQITQTQEYFHVNNMDQEQQSHLLKQNQIWQQGLQNIATLSFDSFQGTLDERYAFLFQAYRYDCLAFNFKKARQENILEETA